MFIGTQMPLTLGFDDARARLATLSRRGLLTCASGSAYDECRSALARDGPPGGAAWGSALGMSRLARVRFRDATVYGNLVICPLRWEVAGAGGALVPVLDADIRLTPAGKDTSLLEVHAVWRPPGGLAAGLDQVILRQTAQATIQAFTDQIGNAVMCPAASPGAGQPGMLPEARPGPETPCPSP